MALPKLVLLFTVFLGITLGQDQVKYPDDYCENIEDDEQFDFVVVGAGPAGAAVARRLAEEPSIRVLLIEAGGDPTPESDIPQNALTLAFNYRWNFTSVSSRDNCQGTLIRGRCLYIPAMMLGGSSVVNFMMYTRGNKADYDEWANMGNEGWGYDDVLPYFKKLENYLAQDVGDSQTNDTVSEEFHMKGGPQDASFFPRDPKTADAKEAIIKAAAAVGINFNSDINGESQLGFTHLPGMVTPQGIRKNSAKAYLLNIPDNLKVCKNAMVNRVILNGKTATGVEYFYPTNGLIPLSSTKKVRATKEVIISAGPLNSAPILERSGIGRPDILSKAGVKLVHNLPGVGENLQDQFINLGSAFRIDYGNSEAVNPNSIDFTDLTGFVSTKGGDIPDIQFILKDYTPLIGLGLGYNPLVQAEYVLGSTMIFGPIILRQEKPGYIHITQSFSPRITPKIDTKQYATPVDLELLVNATRLARKIMAQDALKPFKVKPFVLSVCRIYPEDSDEEIICMAKNMGNTLYHLAGSTSMGPESDPMAVVDDRLRVHGIKNLRVIDSGIMPKVSRANTQIPAVMIGEKGADLIKEDYGFIQ